MSKTSSEVKNRFNNKAYDRINLIVHKGKKSIIKAHAEKYGESVNAFINRAIKATMDADDASAGIVSKE